MMARPTTRYLQVPLELQTGPLDRYEHCYCHLLRGQHSVLEPALPKIRSKTIGQESKEAKARGVDEKTAR